jgi:hypothetical protein
MAVVYWLWTMMLMLNPMTFVSMPKVTSISNELCFANSDSFQHGSAIPNYHDLGFPSW